MKRAVTSRERDGMIELLAPQPGWFRAAIAVGDVVHAGSTLGLLEVLGTHVTLVAPDVDPLEPGSSSLWGRVVSLRDPALARPAVDFGAVLATIDPRAVAGETRAATATAAKATTGRVFKAPTSGRFYGRPSPDKPAFVEAGQALQQGATICLLEVMKTFHRVTYAGEPVTVVKVLVADGADVNAGDALLELR